VDAEAQQARPLASGTNGAARRDPARSENLPMSTVTRRALTAWLVDHGFAELGGKATSHRRFRHESGVVITVPGHGRQNLSQKHVGMIVRQLEDAGFDRDTVRRDLNAR
jgi:predicted RNA binding protein YcfA (HicA-like mRNA interferase family)